MIKVMNIRQCKLTVCLNNWRQNVEALFPSSVFLPLPPGKDGSGDNDAPVCPTNIKPVTCDQAFSLFRGSAKVWQRESRRSEAGREKRTPDTITARVVCRPMFAYVMLSCVMIYM